jgi:pyruvate formate lyase activating enzyme
MQFSSPHSASSIKCLACRHYCIIPEGSFGMCGVRKNEAGKIKLVVYAKPCSMNLDPIEKKPLFHYLPSSKTLSIGFFGCNFKCDFCQNFDITFVRGIGAEKDSMLLNEVTPAKFIDFAKKEEAKSVAITYNEPAITVEYNLDVFIEAKKRENSIGTVYVSNGYESIEQINELVKGRGLLDAINIDLKSFNNDFYKKICGASLEGVLDSIKLFHKAGVWVELTTLLIPNQNDSDSEIKQMAEFILSIDKNIPWHVSAFFPIHKMKSTPPTSKESVENAVRIGKEAGLNFVYSGNVHNSKNESTFCPKCGALLIEREGFKSKVIGMNKNACAKCGEKIKGVFI